MSRSRILRSRLRERVLVTDTAGNTFDGVLYSADSKAIVLKQAEAVGVAEDKTNVGIDNELILLLEKVAWIQRP